MKSKEQRRWTFRLSDSEIKLVLEVPKAKGAREFDLDNSKYKNDEEVLRKLLWHEINLWHSEEECELHLQTLREHDSNFQVGLSSRINLSN